MFFTWDQDRGSLQGPASESNHDGNLNTAMSFLWKIANNDETNTLQRTSKTEIVKRAQVCAR